MSSWKSSIYSPQPRPKGPKTLHELVGERRERRGKRRQWK
jgi:hypothetical protein